MTAEINPAIYAGMKWLIVALSSMVVVILGKIIWDWLTGKSSKSTQMACPMCDIIQDQIKKTEDSLMIIRTRFVDRDEHRDAMETFKGSFSKLDDKMSTMKDDISDIRVAVAGLTPATVKKN